MGDAQAGVLLDVGEEGALPRLGWALVLDEACREDIDGVDGGVVVDQAQPLQAQQGRALCHAQCGRRGAGGVRAARLQHTRGQGIAYIGGQLGHTLQTRQRPGDGDAGHEGAAPVHGVEQVLLLQAFEGLAHGHTADVIGARQVRLGGQLLPGAELALVDAARQILARTGHQGAAITLGRNHALLSPPLV